MLNHIHSSGYELIDLVDLAINFVLTCGKGENKQLFIEFIINTKEIFIHTLINIYSYGYDIILKKLEKKESPHLQKMKINYQKYNELVTELKEKRNNLEKESIKNLEDDETIYEDLLCIICYKQIANTKIKPCLHKGCKECIMTYMVDNLKCFMCRQPIDSIQPIPKEEIEKEKQKIIDKKNGKFVEDEEKEDKKEVKKEETKKENEISDNYMIDSGDDSFNFSD